MAESVARRPQESPTVQIGVGLFVSVAVIGFIWLLISLRLGPDRYPLVAEFHTLGGITEATKVKLRGFTVGQVTSIEFRPMPMEGEAYFLVTLGIETAYPVPTGVFAEIRGSGLVGEAYVHLDVTEADGAPLPAGARGRRGSIPCRVALHPQQNYDPPSSRGEPGELAQPASKFAGRRRASVDSPTRR